MGAGGVVVVTGAGCDVAVGLGLRPGADAVVIGVGLLWRPKIADRMNNTATVPTVIHGHFRRFFLGAGVSACIGLGSSSAMEFKWSLPRSVTVWSRPDSPLLQRRELCDRNVVPYRHDSRRCRSVRITDQAIATRRHTRHLAGLPLMSLSAAPMLRPPPPARSRTTAGVLKDEPTLLISRNRFADDHGQG
jgi:hypothetical protein